MVQMLLQTPGVRLLPFTQAQAYARRLGFLTPVTLPQGVVDDAADIGWLVFEAPPWPTDGRAEALALCALCVRLSERAADPATGALPPPLDWATDTSDDIACLRARLSPARCAALQAWWLTPEVQQLLGPFPRA